MYALGNAPATLYRSRDTLAVEALVASFLLLFIFRFLRLFLFALHVSISQLFSLKV